LLEKTKRFIKVIIVTVLLSTFFLISFAADELNNDNFYSYLSNFTKVHNERTYTIQFLEWNEQNSYGGHSIRNGNEGIVSSKIVDLDKDGIDELLILQFKWYDFGDGYGRNSLDLIICEKTNAGVVEKDRVTLSDDSSCFNGYLRENLSIALHGNYIGYIYSDQPIEGTGITYKICTYDGTKINTIVNLYNPGYTSGVALYDVSNCPKDEYYEKGILLYLDEIDFISGAYPSYEKAVMDKMNMLGVTTYFHKDNYEYETSFPAEDLLCNINAVGDYENEIVILRITNFSDIFK